MTRDLPTLMAAKDQAKQLRADASESGDKISHAQALETVAHQNGFRDWNALCAAISDQPPAGWEKGGKVTGRYLSHPFTATVISVSLARPGWYQLELVLDTAVDVVTSTGFSNSRKRLRGVIGPKGHSLERTSDGAPHLQINL